MQDGPPPSPQRIRYDQAARRHHQDAACLHENGRRANADHLYGISVECALLALMRSSPLAARLFNAEGRIDPRYQTHVNVLWRQFCLDAQGYRLGAQLSRLREAFPGERRQPGAVAPPRNPFQGWSVDQRYLADSAVATEVTDESLERHKKAADVCARMLDSVGGAR